MQKIRNMIRWGVAKLVMKDTTNMPQQQIKSFSAVRNVPIFYPYGLFASAPIDSLALLFNVNCNADNVVAMVTAYKDRFLNLKEGEVVLGNVKSGSFIKLAQDGSATISNPSGSNSIILKANGEIEFNGSVATFNCPVRSTDDIVDNYETNTNSMSDIRTIYNSHVHNENGAGNNTDATLQTM